MLALAATLSAFGLLTSCSTSQLRVHELRQADTKDVCDIRTAVFSPHLEQPMSKIAQNRAWEGSMAEKTKVLVARATGELATTLKRADEFVGFAGDEDEPIIGTGDMQLVPTPIGSCGYINNVCVDPCARKRGVARVMLDAFDTLASRELGASALTLLVDADNIPAIRLYERCRKLSGLEPAFLASSVPLSHLLTVDSLAGQRRVFRRDGPAARAGLLRGALRFRGRWPTAPDDEAIGADGSTL